MKKGRQRKAYEPGRYFVVTVTSSGRIYTDPAGDYTQAQSFKRTMEHDYPGAEVRITTMDEARARVDAHRSEAGDYQLLNNKEFDHQRGGLRGAILREGYRPGFVSMPADAPSTTNAETDLRAAGIHDFVTLHVGDADEFFFKPKDWARGMAIVDDAINGSRS